MAFFSRVGNILKQSVSKQLTSQISASNPSIYQAIRCMSSSKVFVGGLPYQLDDTNLREYFSRYGEVIEARVIIDREQNRSRGFGFVTFSSTEEASSAIQAMDGQDLGGRRVRVNYANDRQPRPYGGGGGYGGGGYSGGGYGGGGYGGGAGGSYGGGNGYGGGQNYGGGYGGGAPAGGQYGGGNSDFGGGYGGGVAGGAGGSDPYYGGGTGNITGGGGFAASGFEEGSGLGSDSSNHFGSNATNGMDNGTSGDYDPNGPSVENFRDDDDQPDDFAKRACCHWTRKYSAE